MNNRINRKWIFISLIILGILFTFTFVSLETNMIFKNSDFDEKFSFFCEQGDAGLVKLVRNEETPSVLDWVFFEKNSEKYVLFSDEYFNERIQIDLPETLERGVYKFDIIVDFIEGEDFKETISFVVI